MLTTTQIDFLNRVCPNKWTYKNGIVDVDSGVNMSNMGLTEIPVQFGQVNGNFICTNNKLTTLKGCPFNVSDFFNCSFNQLTTLEYGPEYADEYSCSNNKLTTLKWSPVNIKIFNCTYNQLTTLECGPEWVNYYYCSNNKLTNLKYSPEICIIFFCNFNNLTSLEGCPSLITYDLYCMHNSQLHILYGVGRIKGSIYYDAYNDLNKWIVEQARLNILIQYADISKWIKHNKTPKFLIGAQKEIREQFAPHLLYLVDSGICNFFD